METKTYEFHQNNSGGSFDTDENVCARVFIEAISYEDAIRKIEPMIESQSSSCPCCGDRWYLSEKIVDIQHFKETGYEVHTYTDMNEDAFKEWERKYGMFPRLSEPVLDNTGIFEKVSARIYFESVDHYIQFMVNEYGRWTTPDARLHRIDGRKKDFYYNADNEEA